MSNNPLISVIIPAYNAEKLIADAIGTVRNQTYEPIEMLVVNDGSSDGTYEAAQAFGEHVRVFDQENGGISAARNAAVAQAKGTFLAFLDHDDLWEPMKLERQMEVFEASPETDVVFTHLAQLQMTHNEDGTLPHDGTLLHVQAGCLPSCMLIKKASFLRVGLFDTEVDVAEFLEWYTRAKDAGLKEHMMKDVLVKRRQHGKNHSFTNGQLHYTRVLKQWIDKKRNQTASP